MSSGKGTDQSGILRSFRFLLHWLLGRLLALTLPNQNRIVECARNHPSNFHRTAAQVTGWWLDHDDRKLKTKEIEVVKRTIMTMELRMRPRTAQSFFARS